MSSTMSTKIHLEHAGPLNPTAKKVKILKVFTTRKPLTQSTTTRTELKNVFDADGKNNIRIIRRGRRITDRSYNNTSISNRKITDYFSVKKPYFEKHVESPSIKRPEAESLDLPLQKLLVPDCLYFKPKQIPLNKDKKVEFQVIKTSTGSKVICRLCRREFPKTDNLETHARLCLIGMFLKPNPGLPW